MVAIQATNTHGRQAGTPKSGQNFVEQLIPALIMKTKLCVLCVSVVK